MGARRCSLPLVLLALAACGEAGERAIVTEPDFKPGPPPAGTCSAGSLPGLIRDYFPGGRANVIVTIAAPIATAPRTTSARTAGFQVMDSIGYLSRDASVTTDPAKGGILTVALMDCMFAGQTTPAADFAKALTSGNGGSYYVRGGGTATADPAGRDSPIIATDFVVIDAPNATNLSGLKPAENKTWSAVLAGNAGSEGRALFFGFPLSYAPAEYEWRTVPAGAVFAPGVVVSVCDNTATSPDAMVFESNVGVLAYLTDTLCDDTRSMTMLDDGWAPKVLAGRLARAVADALAPAPLQAAVLVAARSGSSGTATTFKSRFKTTPVSNVKLTFGTVPRNLKLNTDVTILVRATAPVGTNTEGVNGVCIYITGSNNNGQGTELLGTTECDNTPTSGLSAVTVSRNDVAGYAEFTFKVTKTGGLVLTATSTDADGITGVVGRDGQVFTGDVVKTNVKP